MKRKRIGVKVRRLNQVSLHASPPWPGLCHNTVTSARTQRLHYNIGTCCIVMWGISSALISSLHNSIHPPQMEMNPPKAACVCCPGDGVTKRGGHPCNPSSHPMESIYQYACILRMWLCISDTVHVLYGVHRTRRDGSSFMWHQPCQSCKYTTYEDIQKRPITNC